MPVEHEIRGSAGARIINLVQNGRVQPVSHEPIPFGDLLRVDGVKEELELRSSIGFCALHGGNLERVTDHIAREAAFRSGASYYGVLQPGGMRHHIPSAQLDPAQSSNLTSFIDHCDVVISVHGFGRHGHWSTLHLGGRNRQLAKHVAHHLRWSLAAYRIIDELEAIPRELRGQHPDNPCNLSSSGGVQIELPPRVRGLSPLTQHWPGHDPDQEAFPHINQLIDGLVNAATTWPPPASATNGTIS